MNVTIGPATLRGLRNFFMRQASGRSGKGYGVPQKEIAYLHETGRLGKRGDFYRLLKLASVMSSDIAARALLVLEKHYPEKLAEITKILTEEEKAGSVPFGMRLFIARSLAGAGAVFAEEGPRYQRTHSTTLDILLEKGLLYAGDLPSLSLEDIRLLPEHPNTSPEIREALIFSAYDDGRVAARALKAELAQNPGQREVYRKALFARQQAGIAIPSNLLIYAVKNLGFSKEQLLAFIGLGELAIKPGRVTKAVAAGIARAVEDKDMAAAKELMPPGGLTPGQAGLLNKALSPGAPVAVADTSRMGRSFDVTLVLEAVVEQLIGRNLLSAADLSALAEIKTPASAAALVLVKHPDTSGDALLAIVTRPGRYSHRAYDRLAGDLSAHGISGEQLVAAALASKDLDLHVRAVKRPEISVGQLATALEAAEAGIAKAQARAKKTGLSVLTGAAGDLKKACEAELSARKKSAPHPKS